MEAAFFDLDKTVIDRASIAAFGRPFLKGGLINRRLVARAAVSQLIYLYFGADEERLARVRESMLAVTKGWDRAHVRQIVRETMLQTMEPIMYAEALELMELHRAAGHRVYLVSASPEEIVLPLADLLGADGAICSRGEVDEQGRYTGRMAFYAYGESKALAMRELAERTRLDLAASSAYSDSATDLPMLEAVGRPVAVNPDRPLAKIARERGLGGAPLHEADPPPRQGRAHHAGGDDQPGGGRCGADPVAARPARSQPVADFGRAPGRLIADPYRKARPANAMRSRRRPPSRHATGGRRQFQGRRSGPGTRASSWRASLPSPDRALREGTNLAPAFLVA